MSYSTRKDGPGWRSTSTTCSWDFDPERPSVELPVSPSKIEADERSAPGPMILEGRLLGPSRHARPNLL